VSNGGLVVMDRFQFFVWTLIACIGFVALILMQNPAAVSGFPTLPNGLLYVMGVSATGYLAGKAVRNPGPKITKVTVSPAAVQPNNLHVVLDGENLDKKGKLRIDGALQQTVGPVTGLDQAQGPPAYCSQLTFDLLNASGFATGDHTFEIINADGIGAQSWFTGTPMHINTVDQVPHGSTAVQVSLDIANFRDGSNARWLAPNTSTPVDIGKIERIPPPGVPNRNVRVNLIPGKQPGTGTLTLVTPIGNTDTTSVTVT
jgi:hypothetical protein